MSVNIKVTVPEGRGRIVRESCDTRTDYVTRVPFAPGFQQDLGRINDAGQRIEARRYALTSCSRQADTDRHRTTSDDTGRHLEPDLVRSESNLRIRWPRGRGSSSLPSRTRV